MKQLFFLASLVSLACLSCKSKKDTTKTTEPAKTETTASTSSIVNYRLLVSFISKASGPDNTKVEALIAYVNGHPKKPVYKTVLWGREGESDFYFTLSELTKTEVTSFINEVKKIADGSDMMQIKENVQIEHQGR